MDFNVIVGSFVIVKDNTPKYVVPTSNFANAHLLGVPCQVLNGPYEGEREDIFGNIKVDTVIDVKSCVSGIEYTIPYDWVEGYDSLVEANENAQIIGHHFPEVRELLGKPYWPKDNSYITGLSGETGVDLYHKKCEIVSVPFTDVIGEDDFEDDFEKEYTFILVKYNGKYYRTLFEEWALIEP
jgi:hypothetical protein